MEFLDRQHEQWALLRKPGAESGRSLAIFVHGFLGDYLTTWGRLPELLRDNAMKEPILASWDFLFLGYSTRNVVSYLDIAKLVATQWDSARQGESPFKGRYARVALLGHSLGTLGIRQLLCAQVLQPSGMLKALHGVTLFGTPLSGSGLANFGKWFGGAISDALKPGNPQLRMLKAWNESVQGHLQWKEVRVVLGTDDKVVGNKYADLIKFHGDAKLGGFYNANHRSLVKPPDWNGSFVRDELLRTLK